MLGSNHLPSWPNKDLYSSHYLSMIEAKARKYFQGASDFILVPATEVPETIWPVFSMELLIKFYMSKVGIK